MRTHNVIFREYDIRGIVGQELIIEETYELAKAIAFYLVERNANVKTIAVGMDGREHSSAIKEQLCKGLIDSGLNVVFVGMCTSPMIYFATHTLDVDAAVMITASHNPAEYNGLKICLGKHMLWGNHIRTIGTLFYEKKCITAQEKGFYKEQLIKDNYIAWHVNEFKHLKDMTLPIVFDCGNGAAGIVIPDIINQMGWSNVQLLCADVDFAQAHHTADPTKEANVHDMKNAVLATKAAVGIGFDGDADRMGAMTDQGDLVPGDKLLAVFAQQMIQKNPKMCVVYNVVCSSGLGEILEQWGARSVVTPVGHSVIEEAMQKHRALLAGETSCHFFFKDRHFGYDDGVYAMFRLLEILQETGQTLAQLVEIFPQKYTSPEYRIECAEEIKYVIIHEMKGMFFQHKQYQISTIDGVKVMTNYGWGLVRASNTQPVLSIRFEADSEKGLNHIKEDFIVMLCNYFDQMYIREQLQM